MDCGNGYRQAGLIVSELWVHHERDGLGMHSTAAGFGPSHNTVQHAEGAGGCVVGNKHCLSTEPAALEQYRSSTVAKYSQSQIA